MSGKFVLVASYPKSGNTWTRIVLERLRRGAGRPFSINDLDAKYHGVVRRFAFDNWLPVNAADLLTVEMDGFLPDLYRRLAPELQGITLVKAHDAAKRNFRGEWIYPPDCMPTVIYLVRHPFDVAVSTAHHMSISPETAVDILADDGSARPPHRSMPQSLPQTFGSWSSNADSWIGNSAYEVTWTRYEDLCDNPVPNFLRLAEAAGLRTGREEVATAVDATRFQRLQREEEVAGFKERPHSSPRFFREGRSGTWKGVLDDALCERLVRDHGRVMHKLGYNEDGSTGDIQVS
jgi:aryl sulfotransferase